MRRIIQQKHIKDALKSPKAFLMGAVCGAAVLITWQAYIPKIPSMTHQPSHQVYSADTMDVCFSPGGACTQKLTSTIDGATTSILVQAYSFTSPPIAQALVRAKERGVIVKVTLDKGQERDKHSQMGYVAKAGIPVLIDKPPGLAHNKVMIIDDAIVVTGSFNFTRAAQMRNVENLLFIRNKDLAARYTKQWQDRARVSRVANTKP